MADNSGVKRIAVVGSGVSGLAAFWLLNEYSPHEVHLYEADDRPGGHANTVPFAKKGMEAAPVYVDTFNPPTYPLFLSFLRLKSIPVAPTHMTFSVSRDGGDFEWAGTSLAAVFCQRRNLLSGEMWRMLWDVLRFNACARELLDEGEEGLSIGEYLKREGYSAAFRDNYLIPMTSAIWSTPADRVSLSFPARTLVRFMHNHSLLQIVGKPPWLTIPGGSRTYVNSILNSLPRGTLRLSTAVSSISTSPDSSKVELTTATGETSTYDHVILACHSDTALSILEAGRSGATREEREVLGGIEWSRNRAVLHSDIELMPRRRVAWSAWNYLTSTVGSEKGQRNADISNVSLTYDMNILQHIPESTYGPVLVTLNPPFPPIPDTVIGEWQYDHPLFSAKSVESQKRLPSIQNKRGVSFAGAWTKYGFHEDGFSSGIRAALELGATLPFPLVSPEQEYLSSLAGPAWRVAEFGRRVIVWIVAAWLGMLYAPLRVMLLRAGMAWGPVVEKKMD